MKLLLTGSNGFIGSYFAKHYGQNYSIETFSFLKDNFETLHINNIDVVMHLAALVHQKEKMNESEYIKSNIRQALALAQKAKESGVKQFIFMSSIAVYDSTCTLLKENSLINPTTLYGQSKAKAEKKLLALEDEFFKVSIIRPPMVYGVNAPGNIRSLTQLIDKVPILPFDKIENQRSFVYIGNLCAMIDCIIQTKKSGVFLASDDTPISTTKLIELIANAKNKKISLLHVRLFEKILLWIKPSIYQRLFGNLVVDNSQTKAILNFKNPYSVEDGIRMMVQGQKE